MKAIVYLRISADRTGEELGVSRQREDCLKLAQARGWDVLRECVDNDTSAAGKVARPQFEALLDAVRADEAQVVIAWSLDRLTRNRRDTVRLIETCQEHQVTISLARGSDLDMTTPMGRMMADQLAGWARFEIDQKSERQIRANEQAARDGKPHGTRRPYGFENDLVTIREPEAAVLREFARRLISGHSYSEVALWANKSGHTSTEGHSWRGLNIRKLLTNKRYAGIRTHQGAEYPGLWEPVFDTETWERLQLAIKLKNTKTQGRKYLLTGLLFCGKCGFPLHGANKANVKDGPKARSYVCRRFSSTGLPAGCGGIRRNAEPLEDFIKELVFYRLDSPDLAKLLTDEPNDQLLKGLLNDRTAQKHRLDSLVDDYASGLLTKPQFTRAKTTAETELQRIEGEIDALKPRGLIPVGESVRSAWENSDSDNWRRQLLSLVIKRIDVLPGRNYAQYKGFRFDPKLINISWTDG